MSETKRSPEKAIRWRAAVLMLCDLLELDMRRAAAARSTGTDTPTEGDAHE